MDEAQLVNCLNGEDNLCDIEPSDVLREDLVFDQHRHKISTRQELHQHVEEVGVLEGGVELDDPGAVGLGKNVSLCPDVGQLIFLKHFCLDQGLHRVYHTVRLLLDQLDFSEGTLSDDLDGGIVLGLILSSQEPQVPALFPTGVLP